MKQLIKACLVFIFYFLLFTSLEAQPLKQTKGFTRADTLRGTYGPSRDWWDVLKYDLHVKFNLADSSILGYNVIQFKVLKKGDVMQIDLQEPMILDSIKYVFRGKWIDESFKINFLKMVMHILLMVIMHIY